MIASISVLWGCDQETFSENTDNNLQIYADSLNEDGDFFEVSFPKSYLIKKTALGWTR